MLKYERDLTYYAWGAKEVLEDEWVKVEKVETVSYEWSVL